MQRTFSQGLLQSLINLSILVDTLTPQVEHVERLMRAAEEAMITLLASNQIEVRAFQIKSAKRQLALALTAYPSIQTSIESTHQLVTEEAAKKVDTVPHESEYTKIIAEITERSLALLQRLPALYARLQPIEERFEAAFPSSPSPQHTPPPDTGRRGMLFSSTARPRRTASEPNPPSETSKPSHP